MPSDPEPSGQPCVHCGVPVTQRVGGEPICDACYSERGACCQEWGAHAHTAEDDEDERGGTPPCYAHLFADDDETTTTPS